MRFSKILTPLQLGGVALLCGAAALAQPGSPPPTYAPPAALPGALATAPLPVAPVLPVTPAEPVAAPVAAPMAAAAPSDSVILDMRDAFRRADKARLANLRQHGVVHAGGRVLDQGDLAHGRFVAPTVAGAPLDYRLWREEKFIPLVLVGEVDSLVQGIDAANASDYGLTAGFYGGEHEVATFLDRIEAGVTYVNRPQGATTGAWPGYQPFGGWKGSGSTGKAIGSFWYLPQYLREQSQTVVRRR